MEQGQIGGEGWPGPYACPEFASANEGRFASESEMLRPSGRLLESRSDSGPRGMIAALSSVKPGVFPGGIGAANRIRLTGSPADFVVFACLFFWPRSCPIPAHAFDFRTRFQNAAHALAKLRDEGCMRLVIAAVFCFDSQFLYGFTLGVFSAVDRGSHFDGFLSDRTWELCKCCRTPCAIVENREH